MLASTQCRTTINNYLLILNPVLLSSIGSCSSTDNKKEKDALSDEEDDDDDDEDVFDEQEQVETGNVSMKQRSNDDN